MQSSIATKPEAGVTGVVRKPLLLEARALQCVKNDVMLFSDLYIGLAAGEVLQIDGTNGSGKTSLIRILCGLAQADEGEVSWCGNNIQHYRSEFVRELAYVAHANGVKTDLTVMENLLVARALCSKTGDRSLADILRQMDLQEHAFLPAANLSSGQRRRLALSRLLIANVRLWVLDEPFNSLDENSKKLMTGIIISHVDAGGSVILTTHEAIEWQGRPVKVIGL